MILLTGFSYIGEAGVKYIEYASAGILVFVLLIVYKFIRKNYAYNVTKGIKKEHIIILLTSFFLFSGNAVRRLITGLFALEAGALPGSVFAITMLDLIMILFFIVCFVGPSKSKIKFGIAVFISAFFALSRGRMGILGNISIPLMIVMFVLALSSIIYDVIYKSDKTKKSTVKVNYRPLLNVLLFIAVGFGLSALTFLVSRDSNAWQFAFRGVTSSLTSFGGGEVYYAIAYETFVETNFIPRDYYMSRILGLAGAMPGPVICSILAGVGFTYGSMMGGAAVGWAFGILGASMAITATGMGALSLFTVFGILRESPRLKMIVMFVIPLVCGVLISVSMTLLLRASEVIASVGIPLPASFAIVIIMFILMVFANKKYRINDMILFLIGGLTTLAMLTVLGGVL
jgi:chromate transporter